MQLDKIRPSRIRTVPFRARFDAALVAGAYRFDHVNFIGPNLNTNSGYLIKSILFSASINADLFSDAADSGVNDGAFLVQFQTALGRWSQNTGRIPLQSFAQYLPVEIFMLSQVSSSGTGQNQQREALHVITDGSLLQTPALTVAGITNISLYLSVNMYEIGDPKAVAWAGGK